MAGTDMTGPTGFPVFGPRPWVVGVLNVTPDSFSDGGLWADTDRAVEHGLQLVADGADIVDVGGESTRPGAHRVDAATERARVLPVIGRLSAHGVACSVDTTRAEVAEAAIDAGAVIVNDVSGGLAEPRMAAVLAAAGVPWILMHWRGPSDTMDELARYDDVVADVTGELLARVDAALAAGVDERSLIIDPGLGFAKNAAHNWQLLARLPELVGLGLPVLVGTSRKRFLGSLLATDATPRPPSGRDVATAATSLLAAQCGVWGVRVHDARGTRDALSVLGAMMPSRRDRTVSAGPLADASAAAGVPTGRLRRPVPAVVGG
jgi:dihydropteroate synthase